MSWVYSDNLILLLYILKTNVLSAAQNGNFDNFAQRTNCRSFWTSLIFSWIIITISTINIFILSPYTWINLYIYQWLISTLYSTEFC